MKPHLKRVHYVWHCWQVGTTFHVYCGLGFTPKEAYEDWMRLIAKMEKA